MSRKTRTHRIIGSASILFSIGALALTGMASVAAGTDPIPNTDATTSAAVDTKELCVWYVSGVAGDVALIPDAGADTLYDGTVMDLTSGDTMTDVQIYVSGNDPDEEGGGTIDAHRDCTFYGVAEGISFQAELEAGSFLATDGDDARDEDMDFAPGDESSLVYDATGDGCRSGADGTGNDWTIVDLEAVNGGGVAATAIATLAVADVVAQQSDTNEQNSACIVSQVVTVSVPDDLTPASPGTNYTFTGPTLTFSFVIDED
jgi:hypothetical protein